MKNPYEVIKRRYITEKATVLEQLQNNQSNRSVARCKSPKYVFIVDDKANKQEISQAVETLYKEKSIKVVNVNTMIVKGKQKKRGRGRVGFSASFKKAIVTLEEGDSLDNV